MVSIWSLAIHWAFYKTAYGKTGLYLSSALILAALAKGKTGPPEKDPPALLLLKEYRIAGLQLQNKRTHHVHNTSQAYANDHVLLKTPKFYYIIENILGNFWPAYNSIVAFNKIIHNDFCAS
jgi:hypothetical protein